MHAVLHDATEVCQIVSVANPDATATVGLTASAGVSDANDDAEHDATNDDEADDDATNDDDAEHDVIATMSL